MTSPGELTEQEIDDFYRTHRIPTTGDAVALFQAMIAGTWVGIVGDPDTPPMASATMAPGSASISRSMTSASASGGSRVANWLAISEAGMKCPMRAAWRAMISSGDPVR